MAGFFQDSFKLQSDACSGVKKASKRGNGDLGSVSGANLNPLQPKIKPLEGFSR
jgi:hypothetical protein